MKRRLLVVAAMLVVVGSQAAYAERGVKSMEAPRGVFDRAEHFQQMMELQQQLRSEAIDLRGAPVLEVAVSASDREQVRQGRAREQKMRVGVVKELSVPMAFARKRGIQHHEVFGATLGREDGGVEWAGVVRSPDAAGVRIHFTDFDLPEGAELYVYNDRGMAYGPYTGEGPNATGEFWTQTIEGSEVTVRLSSGGAGSPRFTVAGVGHLTEEFALAGHLAPVTNAANTKPCSYNANCTLDAACVPTDAAVTTARDAVAHILFVSGAYLYICTGGLVADSVGTSNVPYFITANHCISRASEASSMETFFFYRASQCQSCPDPGAASTTGATLLSTNKASDYTLMRLSQNAPSGAAFLGWSSAAVATVNNTPLFRLSHPQGAPQAYSTHRVDTTSVTCRSWPRGGWIYSRDTLGATEGGSSGSPVVNALGQLVGQLSGGCGYNVNDVCDAAQNATVDGAFAAYYANVTTWLGSGSGGGGCTDNDGDGVCVENGDCNDNNASVYPGANDTKGKAGRDNVDNDCDGIVNG